MVEDDVFHDIPAEAVAATALDVGNMQTVAASWLEDPSTDRSLRNDIDAFLMKATIALTSCSCDLCASTAAISAEWHGLNSQIQASRDVAESELQVEALEKMLLDDGDSIEKDEDSDIEKSGTDVKMEVKLEKTNKDGGIEESKNKRRRLSKKTICPARIAQEEATVRLRGARDGPTAYNMMVQGVDITAVAEDVDSKLGWETWSRLRMETIEKLHENSSSWATVCELSVLKRMRT